MVVIIDHVVVKVQKVTEDDGMQIVGVVIFIVDSMVVVNVVSGV